MIVLAEFWYRAVWIVLVYSLLGWCSEVAFAAVKTGSFVNRGFLNGPVCPIYGCGVLIVLLVLEPVKENLALLFFGSMVFCSALEFLVGFALERIFHDKWWDYSECPFNLMGYVCLEFSLMWGIACVLVVDVLHPLIAEAVQRIPTSVGVWLELFFGGVMLVDAVLTLVELAKLPKRFKAIGELENALTALSDTVGEKLIYEPMARGKERGDAFAQAHPVLTRKARGTAQAALQKREEINSGIREREDDAKAALAERRRRLEERLAALREGSFVQRRIIRAYPALLKGQRSGALFRRLREQNNEEEKKSA